MGLEERRTEAGEGELEPKVVNRRGRGEALGEQTPQILIKFWPSECGPEIEVEPAYRRRNERESPRSESSPGDAAERERQKVRQDRSAVCA